VTLRPRQAVLAAAILLVSFASALPAAARPANPGVVDVKDEVLGRTYAEWSVEWWTWLFSTPGTLSTFSDGVVDCVDDQPFSDVLFLVGPVNTGATVERTCAEPISSDTFIFFPVLNIECSSLEVDTIFFGGTPQERRRCARSFAFSDLHASVDGQVVDKLKQYAVTSDDFAVTSTTGNAGLLPVGSGRSTSYGIWVMLEPLPAGDHTINFGGTFPDFDFTLDVTYHIEVV
jgi:hypothetical protein